MVRRLIETIYYLSARIMPCWTKWQTDYVTSAWGYFQCNEHPDFVGWPWRWRLVLDDGEE